MCCCHAVPAAALDRRNGTPAAPAACAGRPSAASSRSSAAAQVRTETWEPKKKIEVRPSADLWERLATQLGQQCCSHRCRQSAARVCV